MKYLFKTVIFLTPILVLLLYNYLQNPIIIIDSHSHLTLYNPYCTYEYYLLNISYKRLIDIDFKFKIIPRICKRQPFLLMIIVSSDLYNNHRRKAIRETWGRASDAVKIVFSVGINNDTKNAKAIVSESRKNRDILQGNFMDSYRNLTYKHMMGLKWVYHHCPSARYILKTDDDIFVNIFALLKVLVRELSPWGTKELIACAVWPYMSADRDKKSRWYVTKEEYAEEKYPSYCGGSSILFSGDVIPWLLEASQRIKYFYIDDVYVSGILPENISLWRTDTRNLLLKDESLTTLWKWGLRGTRTFLYGPINVNPAIIYRMWKAMPGVKEIYL